MKTLIIYCHPNDSEKQNKLLISLIDELNLLGHESLVFNMIGDLFSDKLMTNEEVELPKSEEIAGKAKQIQDEISDANHIVFLFPYYWNDMASYVRRFVDKVFLSAWGGGKVFATEKKLKHVKATIITSMRIPQILFSSRSAGGYSDPFTISILKLCGIKNIKWFNIGYWSDLNPKIKEKKLEKIRDYLQKL